MGRGSGSERKSNDKRRKMSYIHVLTPHQQCKYYVLHSGTNELKMIKSETRNLFL